MLPFKKTDINMMSRAISLARKVKGYTFPNPAVGAVIAKKNRIVGKGATCKYGESHAEIVALNEAGIAARGSTLYVTLEPCCFYGKTPPCTDRIISSGIKKVFIAIRDPNPLVSGKGIKKLRKNGIVIYTGLMKNEAIEINEDFFWAVTKKRSWVTLKVAMSLDGRIACRPGRSIGFPYAFFFRIDKSVQYVKGKRNVP